MKNKIGVNKESMVIFCSVIFIFFIFLNGLSGSELDYRHFSKVVNNLFEKRITKTTPGAAVVVTVEGKPVFKKCYGLASLEHNIPITAETRFNLASVAKQFTAFSILLLENEGKINLDDNIRKYLPKLPEYDHVVTVQHLLNHTSGIWEYLNVMSYFAGNSYLDYFTLDYALEILKQQDKLLFEPGSEWSYCNANYVLLTQIVFNVTGESFRSWTQKNIFQPLGMNNSFFHETSFQVIKNKATPYRKKNNGDFIIGSSGRYNYAGSSDLYTTIEDMVLWMDNFRTRSVGGKDVIGKMFQKTKLNNGKESFYGYGLGVSTRSGKQIIGHSGQTGGYKTFMLYCPENEVGITILANKRSFDAAGIGNKIFDLYIGENLTDQPLSKKEQEFLPLNPKNAALYTGGYIVEGLNVKLAVNIGEHSLHCAFWGLGDDYFYPLTEKRYSNRSRVNFVEFHKGKNGIPDKVMITIRQDKMTANKIVLGTKELDVRLPDYLGNYYSETFSIVYTFDIADGRLVMHHPRYSDMRIEPIDKDEYFFKQGFLKFKRNQDKKVTGFTLTPSDEKFHFQSFEFIKVESGE